MSLGIAIKGPEGIVLAADSRITLAIQHQSQDGPVILREFHFDNSKKLLQFSGEEHGFVGVTTYGMAVVPGTMRTAHSYFPEFEETLEEEGRLKVLDYAERLSDFYHKLWKKHAPADHDGPDMVFIIGGFDKEDLYGKIFVVGVPSALTPEPRNPDDFGMTWGGQLRIPSRIVKGFEPELLAFLAERFSLDEAERNALDQELKQKFEYQIPYQFLPLQDCVDLAIVLIQTTVDIQSRAAVPRGVGGITEVATITRTEPLKFLRQKSLRADLGR